MGVDESLAREAALLDHPYLAETGFRTTWHASSERVASSGPGAHWLCETGDDEII